MVNIIPFAEPEPYQPIKIAQPDDAGKGYGWSKEAKWDSNRKNISVAGSRWMNNRINFLNEIMKFMPETARAAYAGAVGGFDFAVNDFAMLNGDKVKILEVTPGATTTNALGETVEGPGTVTKVEYQAMFPGGPTTEQTGSWSMNEFKPVKEKFTRGIGEYGDTLDRYGASASNHSTGSNVVGKNYASAHTDKFGSGYWGADDGRYFNGTVNYGSALNEWNHTKMDSSVAYSDDQLNVASRYGFGESEVDINSDGHADGSMESAIDAQTYANVYGEINSISNKTIGDDGFDASVMNQKDIFDYSGIWGTVQTDLASLVNKYKGYLVNGNTENVNYFDLIWLANKGVAFEGTEAFSLKVAISESFRRIGLAFSEIFGPKDFRMTADTSAFAFLKPSTETNFSGRSYDKTRVDWFASWRKGRFAMGASDWQKSALEGYIKMGEHMNYMLRGVVGVGGYDASWMGDYAARRGTFWNSISGASYNTGLSIPTGDAATLQGWLDNLPIKSGWTKEIRNNIADWTSGTSFTGAAIAKINEVLNCSMNKNLNRNVNTRHQTMQTNTSSAVNWLPDWYMDRTLGFVKQSDHIQTVTGGSANDNVKQYQEVSAHESLFRRTGDLAAVNGSAQSNVRYSEKMWHWNVNAHIRKFRKDARSSMIAHQFWITQLNWLAKDRFNATMEEYAAREVKYYDDQYYKIKAEMAGFQKIKARKQANAQAAEAAAARRKKMLNIAKKKKKKAAE